MTSSFDDNSEDVEAEIKIILNIETMTAAKCVKKSISSSHDSC